MIIDIAGAHGSAEQYDNNLVKLQYLFLIPSNYLNTTNTVNSKV